jgi:hypothetical protein
MLFVVSSLQRVSIENRQKGLEVDNTRIYLTNKGIVIFENPIEES